MNSIHYVSINGRLTKSTTDRVIFKPFTVINFSIRENSECARVCTCARKKNVISHIKSNNNTSQANLKIYDFVHIMHVKSSLDLSLFVCVKINFPCYISSHKQTNQPQMFLSRCFSIVTNIKQKIAMWQKQ